MEITYNEILENIFVPLYGISLLLSIVYYKKYFESTLRYLPIIIGYTFANEILGILIKNKETFQIVYSEGNKINNNIIFNIWEIIFFLYFFNIFWKALEKTRYKKIIKYGAGLYIITSFINPFIQSFVLYPQAYALTIASIVLILSTIFYFIELKQNRQSTPITNDLLFWISIGLFVFHLFYPFIMGLICYKYDIFIKWNIRPLHLSLIVFMYSCFIIGFFRMRYIKPISKN